MGVRLPDQSLTLLEVVEPPLKPGRGELLAALGPPNRDMSMVWPVMGLWIC